MIQVRPSRQTVDEKSHFGAVSTKARMLRNSGFAEEGTRNLELL